MAKRIRFRDVPVGGTFIFYCNICRKVSSRTGLLIQYTRTFYFKQNDIVEVNEDYEARE